MADHYREVIGDWRKKALSFDYKQKYQALGLGGYSAMGDLKIRFFGREYGICRDTAEIYDIAAPEQELSFSTHMGIYHIFHYSLPYAKASERWVPLREIRRAAPFERAFLQQTLRPFAEFCNGRAEDLRNAAERLGFRRLPKGDVGIEAEVFDCLKMRMFFWDGDEEFPPQVNMLFDANANDFLHEETVIMMGMELARMLKEEMGE